MALWYSGIKRKMTRLIFQRKLALSQSMDGVMHWAPPRASQAAQASFGMSCDMN